MQYANQRKKDFFCYNATRNFKHGQMWLELEWLEMNELQYREYGD